MLSVTDRSQHRACGVARRVPRSQFAARVDQALDHVLGACCCVPEPWGPPTSCRDPPTPPARPAEAGLLGGLQDTWSLVGEEGGQTVGAALEFFRPGNGWVWGSEQGPWEAGAALSSRGVSRGMDLGGAGRHSGQTARARLFPPRVAGWWPGPRRPPSAASFLPLPPRSACRAPRSACSRTIYSVG